MIRPLNFQFIAQKYTHRYRKEISDLPEASGEEHVGKKEKDLSNGILKVIHYMLSLRDIL